MSETTQELRRAVAAMAEQMFVELLANQHKGNRPGWLACQPMALVLEVFHHAAKLHAAVVASDPELTREYAADVANMALMVADRCGVLGLGPAEAGAKHSNTQWTDEVLGRTQ